eukprot:m.51117 g.51117  ORF g.51117 m.51117 type:complete len:507 (+) comp6588_c0_seq2:1-1521(+)
MSATAAAAAAPADAVPLVFAAAACLKLLLLPAYFSTDFDVHRNWLAVTQLPLREWYTEATSEWTLDYPPLFGWLEYALSFPAQLFDPGMLEISAEPYRSPATVVFQRLSVVASDVTLLLACWLCWPGASSRFGIAVLVFFNTGFFIVDAIHFQYNGFLFGILLISMAYLKRESYLLGAAAFAALLNFKHIFLYIAPAYFVFLLRAYCLQRGVGTALARLAVLGTIVIGVFALSLGPFVFEGQLPALAERLFPFKRGLSHAFWASNFWALYNTADKVLAAGSQRFGLVAGDSEALAATARLTGGLVTDTESHAVLPAITPMITLVLSVAALLPCLVLLWRNPTFSQFVRSIVLCGFAAFLFGWHVHEKAVMVMVVPWTLLVVEEAEREGRAFFMLCAAGHYALLPLLFEPQETAVKLLLYGLFLFLVVRVLEVRLGLLEKVYLAGIVVLQVFVGIVHPLVFGQRLPFLPLLATSAYCAVGVLYAWLGAYRSAWTAPVLARVASKKTQ